MAENGKPVGVRGSHSGSEMAGYPPGLSHKDSEEWGSIADLLKSIEGTNQSRAAKAKGAPSPQPRMPPLTENIQSSGMSQLMEMQRGQGMQQLNHLLRLMDQMCALQQQNSKLREQAEYLAAVKNLHELRNETMRQNCHCEGHRRASDLSSSSGSRFEATHMTGESLSEPESQIGDDLEVDITGRGSKRGRSSKRDGKNKSLKKRSRSLDPFGDENESKDRSKQGLFSKIEKMKEKLSSRRSSVKRRSNSRGDGSKSDEEGEDGKSGHIFHVDGIETKSEDSGIFHIDPEDITAAARLEAFLQKSHEDLSDNEDIFQGTAPPPWARTAMLAQSRRKGSDLSSSSEDYLEAKPKRTSPGEDRKQTSSACQDSDDLLMKRSRFRRVATCPDTTPLDTADPEKLAGQRAVGPVEERLKQKRLQHQSHSLDIEMTDASGASERESEFKQPQKRKYFRKSQTAELDDQSSSSVSMEATFKDVRSPKASPPEKKKHKVGWEKVKNAMSKKNLAEANRGRLLTSSTEESPPIAKRQEMAEDGYLSPGDSTDDGMRKGWRRDGAGGRKMGSQKREKDLHACVPDHEPLSRSKSNKSDHSCSSGISEEFARKLEEWERMRLRNSGQTPLSKQGSHDSGSDVPVPRQVNVEDELNKGLTEEFSKKLAEWEKLKKSGYGATSPKSEPKQKRISKDKKEMSKPSKDKQKNKDSPLLGRRSKSPEGKLSRNIVVIEDADGQLKLEGASKEFSRRFQEWEKMRSQSSLNTSDSDSPSQRLQKQSSEEGFSKESKEKIVPSRRSLSGDSVRSAATETSKSDGNQCPKKLVATSQEAGSQAEFPEDVGPGDDAGFVEADEHISKLEEKNTFLATQLKRRDVNLQAVQSELETMQQQLEQIGGVKRDPVHKRTSICSSIGESIGESLLEEELNEIKCQVEKIEEEFQLRNHHQPPASTSSPLPEESLTPKAKGQDVMTSDMGSEVNDDTFDSTGCVDEGGTTEPLKLPEKTQAEVQRVSEGAPSEDLRRSLQQRENMIRLLQTELERQSQEITILRNQGNAFKRAKSFSARDQVYNPSLQTLGLELSRHTNESASTPSISESPKARHTASPSLQSLHISAEDIRMEEENLRRSAPSVPRSQANKQPPSNKQNVSSTSKDQEKICPGLYGPVETSSRRRRSTDVKEAAASDKQRKEIEELKEKARKEEEKPKEETVEDIVARRRARREARRNVRLGITLSHEKDPTPDNKEEKKPPVKRAEEEKRVAKVSSSSAITKAVESATESPRMRRRRDRQSGHQHQLAVDESGDPGVKSPLSSKVRDHDRDMFSDTTNDSEQESISLRSDSDIRRRFESILAHRRRESSDSVSSSRRSSPSTGRLYDSNFSRNRVNPDVQNLRKKFTGGSNVAQAGPVKQKSKSLKYEKEKPREGSVKALTQTFTGDKEEKKNGSGSNKSSPRSLSPASSTGSVSTGIAEKIKKLKGPNDIERPLERRKSADLIKARVALLDHEKSSQPETEHRKSMPAIQAVRSKFERNDCQESPLPTTKKSSGKISYTVSVTDSDKENSESSKVDDKSARQKARTARLVAVMETPGSDKKQETVTFTVNSHARRRYGTVDDNKNNSNSKDIGQEVKDSSAKSLEKKAKNMEAESKVTPTDSVKREETSAARSRDNGEAREKGGRRRRRHKVSTQEDKKDVDEQKPEAGKPDTPKAEPPKPEPTVSQNVSIKKTEAKESHQGAKQESGKKGRRRNRQRKGQSEESGDRKISEAKPQESEVNEKQANVPEKEERRRYEKKDDVTKPSERHIQKKDKESTLTTLKRMVSKREEMRPDVKIRDPTRARMELENKSSSIESVEGNDYPDLLAQTRVHDKEKSNALDDGNGKRRPHSMVAESGLKGAAAAIGQPIPKSSNENEDKEKEKDKPKEVEEDDRRSRKETTRRGRFLSKADKFDLFRRARSVGPGKSKDRSPSAERKSKGLRSSSIDRSKVASRAKSPEPGKSGKKKGGSIGGFLKASKV